MKLTSRPFEVAQRYLYHPQFCNVPFEKEGSLLEMARRYLYHPQFCNVPNKQIIFHFVRYTLFDPQFSNVPFLPLGPEKKVDVTEKINCKMKECQFYPSVAVINQNWLCIHVKAVWNARRYKWMDEWMNETMNLLCFDDDPVCLF